MREIKEGEKNKDCGDRQTAGEICRGRMTVGRKARIRAENGRKRKLFAGVNGGILQRNTRVSSQCVHEM